MQLNGIYTPLITPFRDDLTIDFDAFGKVIDWQIENGVHGLIIGGSTGEFYALTPAERIDQFDFAARQIAGRCAFIAGVNDLRVSDCFAVTKGAQDAGADALLVGAPPYSLPSAHELVEHCRNIDQIANLPIILYNYPVRSGVAMGDEFLGMVCEIENVVAIKESSGELARIHSLARNFPQLQLSAGAEDLVLEFFAWGAKSWVSVVANFMPREAVAFHQLCVQQGDFDRGRQIMRALLPLMHCLEHGGAFIQSVKHACKTSGRPGGPVRLPLQPIGTRQRDEVAGVVVAARTEIDMIISA
ncbi:MAG: dihydrodipicolinate synthase family protein [Woeseia sp.]|nr:dihydrodipicolinate synthase family protein [Woeseia sp.]